MGHVGKSESEARIIRSSQRIGALQIDVVAKHHQSSLAVIEVDCSGRVGEDGGANSEPSEDTYRKCNFLRRISFIKVHAALHHCYGNARDFADR